MNSKKERSPYITQGLKNSIREKNRLERLSHKWPLTYKERYRVYRNKLTSLLKAAKKKYNQDQLVNNQGNPKSHWRSINKILGRSTANKNTDIDLTPNCDDIPNNFNDHFLKAGCSRNDDDGDEFLRYLHNYPNYSFYLSPVTQLEIENYLKLKKTNVFRV